MGIEDWKDCIPAGEAAVRWVMEERKVSASPLGVPPIASHHERLIGEVEGSDGQLGAILRWDLW